MVNRQDSIAICFALMFYIIGIMFFYHGWREFHKSKTFVNRQCQVKSVDVKKEIGSFKALFGLFSGVILFIIATIILILRQCQKIEFIPIQQRLF